MLELIRENILFYLKCHAIIIKNMLDCRTELIEKDKVGYVLKNNNIIALIGYRESLKL